MKIRISASVGELIDKVTILEIKLRVIKDPDKWTNCQKDWLQLSNTLAEVEKEAGLLTECGADVDEKTVNYFHLINGLRATNQKLWDLEDEIRVLESENIPMELDIALFELSFESLGKEDMAKARRFIELARLVYITNDQRCKLKKGLDIMLGSELTEEKGYKA